MSRKPDQPAAQKLPDAVLKAEELLSEPLPCDEPDRSREIKRRVEQVTKLLSPQASPA